MAKDKLIKVRATDYDKAVLKALAKKLDNVYTISSPLSDSDVVRLGIDMLVKEYLKVEEIQELRKSHYNNKN